MRLLRYRHACPVGIEIRSSEIRLARLARLTKGTYRLECADIGYLSLERCAAVDWTALRDLLGRMVRAQGLEGLPAVVSLPASGVRMQRMPLPVNLPSYAVEAAVQGQLRQGMFGLAGSVCVDYAELTAEAAREREVYFVASRQELLAQYVECAASAGLEVKIVDVDVFALLRAVCQLMALRLSVQQAAAFLVHHEQAIEWIVYDGQAVLYHQIIDAAKEDALELLVAAQLKKVAALSPQLKIHYLVISADRQQMGGMELITRMGVIVRYAELPQSRRTAPSYQLLTACGLSMRELPPWC